MSLLFQFEQHGPFRPMNQDGTKPDGDCVRLPEEQAVYMGSGITDERGVWSLEVRPATCIGLFIIDWVSMVATPSSRIDPDERPHLSPSFVTTAWSALGGNLRLYVRSWGPHGEPAPHVPFSWHAAVVQHLE